MTEPTSESRSIHRRLLLAGAAIVITALLGCAATITVAASTLSTLNREISDSLELGSATEKLQIAISDQEVYVFDYSIAGEPEAIAGYHEAEVRELTAYEILQGSFVSPAVAAAAGRVRELTSAWRRHWIEPYLAGVAAGRMPTGPTHAQTRQTYDAPMMAAVDELAAVVAAEEAAAFARAQSASGTIGVLLAPIGVISMLVIGLTWWWVNRTISKPLIKLNSRARQVMAGADLPFVAERDDEIGELAQILERMRQDAAGRYQTARLEADRAAIFNQLAELISFARDEDELVSAAIRTLQRFAPAPRGDLMLVNNSTNRLLIAGAWGENQQDQGPAPVDRIDRCPGIRRATAYVAADLTDDLTVRCPAHPADAGTVACVPMPALGTLVGVVHLEHPEPGAFDAETLAVIARVAEQVALAIANARLMHTMEGLAMTDPLTGLRNPRYFDDYLDQELAEAARDRESTSLLMLDVDHFKAFNDTHGHPAGDEALRCFARVLRSMVRSSDVIARYGGEEFVISLHHTGLADALRVAEKVRAAVEQAVVEIGPGRYARMTVSIGVASSPSGRTDPRGLIAMADAALYQAKESGRNRVEASSGSQAAPEAASRAAAAQSAPRSAGALPISHLRRGSGPHIAPQAGAPDDHRAAG